jgi:hypothetical protein
MWAREDHRCQSPTDTCDSPQEAVLYLVYLATPRAGMPLIRPSAHPPGADRSDYTTRHRRIIAETEQETYLPATYDRRQRQLKLRFY